MASYTAWRKGWNIRNSSKDSLLKCVHDKRDLDVHERGSGLIAKQGEEIKIASGSFYADESGKFEVWGCPTPLFGVDLGATISKPDYVFDLGGTERPVIETCEEYLAVIEQMVAQFEAHSSNW